MTLTPIKWSGPVPSEALEEWTTDPNIQHTRTLVCGHTVSRKQHVWITSRGADACRQECINRLEQHSK